ncbi:MULTISPECIES: MlaD family protein [Ignavibacterium]|jgi:phospholipid/cholesterol/gamma-HCH transport system substrate-binding protein|uniref:MlaD family protein n=1 Tax=Ignavibacterium TaxID=795750 RepID=UPI0025BEDAEA|nr:MULTISPECIES: MlaD family protein [Ignavibacterium]
MKDQRKTEIKVGLTVLAAIIIFLWIFGWAKNISIRSTENIIKVSFRNVAGLEIGDPVTVNGFRKGYVNDMKVLTNEVIVEIALDNDVILKEDATFSVSMLDLMGGKKIEIYPGESSVALNLKEIHHGVFLSDIPAVMSLLGSVQDDLVTVLKDVKITLSSVNQYLTDEKLSNDLKQSLKNFNSLTAEINDLLKQNKENMKLLTNNVISLTENTNRLIETNEQNVSDLLKHMNEVVEKSNKLLTNVNQLSDETLQKQNNLGKILYDEELIKNIKTSLKQINELTSILIEQLKGKGINVDANIF